MYLQMYIPPLSFYMSSVKGKAERSSYIIVIHLFNSGKKSVDISFTINYCKYDRDPHSSQLEKHWIFRPVARRLPQTTFELLEHLQSSSAMHEQFAYNGRNDPLTRWPW